MFNVALRFSIRDMNVRKGIKLIKTQTLSQLVLVLYKDLPIVLFLSSDGKGWQTSKKSGFNKAPRAKLINAHTFYSLEFIRYPQVYRIL